MLRQNGLALGGSLENAIVLGETGVLNNALRFDDEFVRHKILDAVGDLALVGYPVIGHLVAHRAGHALHTEFAAKILEEAQRLASGRVADRRRGGADSVRRQARRATARALIALIQPAVARPFQGRVVASATRLKPLASIDHRAQRGPERPAPHDARFPTSDSRLLTPDS